MAQKQKLTANNLKESLWETLQGLKDGTIEPGNADAIASQAREIVRTASLQLRVASQSQRQVPSELISFSENGG